MIPHDQILPYCWHPHWIAQRDSHKLISSCRISNQAESKSQTKANIHTSMLTPTKQCPMIPHDQILPYCWHPHWLAQRDSHELISSSRISHQAESKSKTKENKHTLMLAPAKQCPMIPHDQILPYCWHPHWIAQRDSHKLISSCRIYNHAESKSQTKENIHNSMLTPAKQWPMIPHDQILPYCWHPHWIAQRDSHKLISSCRISNQAESKSQTKANIHNCMLTPARQCSVILHDQILPYCWHPHWIAQRDSHKLNSSSRIFIQAESKSQTKANIHTLHVDTCQAMLRDSP